MQVVMCSLAFEVSLLVGLANVSSSGLPWLVTVAKLWLEDICSGEELSE